MQKSLRFFSLFAAMGAVALLAALFPAGPARASETLAKVEAVSCPIVKMEHWRNSSRDEKLAFLFGFSSLLELEKEWQGSKPLPIKQSIVGSWVRGLDGVTLGQMCDAIDRYAAQHPEEGAISVLEVLGSIYVRPKMTQAEIAAGEKRAREIRSSLRRN